MGSAGRALITGITPADGRVACVSRPVDPAAWTLAAFPAPTVVWKDAGTLFLGAGEAAILSHPDDVRGVLELATATVLEGEAEGPPGAWFGGFAFDPRAPSEGWWAGFPAVRFVVPELLLERSAECAVLHALEPVDRGGLGAARERARRRLDAARPAAAAPPHRPPALVVAEDAAAWSERVHAALGQLKSGALRKIVLARAVDVAAAEPFRLDAVLARCTAETDAAVVFAVRGTDGSVFLGASPERLCAIDGRRLRTQALASSAAPREAARLGGDKERREHAWVVEDIRAALLPLSLEVQVAASAEPLSLSYVTHLCTSVEAWLRPGVTVVDAVLALHPTAAMGGSPRGPALAFLRSHEGLARGWYAGAVGWAGHDRVDLRVAIRSAVLAGRAARLFVGSGMVLGSNAESEWRETALKCGPMLRALGGEPAWPA